MTGTISEHILQALAEAGPAGLTATRLALIVSACRGRPTSQETISASISQYKTSHPRAPFLRLKIVRRIRYWTLVEAEVAQPELEPTPSAKSLSSCPTTLTAMLLGDPAPGRSALDQRRAA